MVDKKQTPTPRSDFAPVRVEAADWFDLPANDTVTQLDVRRFGDQAIDVRKVGARPETDVSIEVETSRETNDGRRVDTDTFDTTALVDFGNVSDAGPFATNRLTWSFRNRSATAYTEGNGNVYQAHINYLIRRMSVVEKLRRQVPLDDSTSATGPETRLAEETGLLDRERAELPQRLPTYLQPTLEEKVIRERESAVQTVTISATGESDRERITKEANLRERGVVVYVTGLEINSQDYTESDRLKVRFTRAGSEDFYDLDTYGLPGFSNDYEAELFLPFTEQMNVSVWNDNNSNNVSSDVDVNLEYAVVERTIVEQALYGLIEEVDDESRFEEMQRQIRAGVPIDAGFLTGGA